MPEFCFVVQKRYKKMMYKAYKWLILTVEQQKRRPVKSAISIDYNQFNSLIIRWLLADAAYIAAWMIDCCNLIGRKVVFETSETCFWGCFTLFSQWIRTMRKYCILNEVHLSSIRLQRYKIPWCFRQECQLNARYSHG